MSPAPIAATLRRSGARRRGWSRRACVWGRRTARSFRRARTFWPTRIFRRARIWRSTAVFGRPARRPWIWPRPVRTAGPQSFGGHALADRVAGAQALQHATVARHFARRNLKRQGAHAAPRRAADGESAGAPVQRAEAAALAVEDLDLADMAVGIGIELDLGFGGRSGPAARRHFDHTGRTANAERGTRGTDLHVAGFGHKARHEGGRSDRDIEACGIAGAALLINEGIDDDARIGRQAERRLIVEGDPERGIRPGDQRVVLEEGIVDAQRHNLAGVAARHRCAALDGRDLSDLARRCGSARGDSRILRARREGPEQHRRRRADCAQGFDEVAPFQIGLGDIRTGNAGNE